MYSDTINTLISQGIINKNGKVSPWLMRKISTEMIEQIHRLTSFLDEETDVSVRIKTMQLGITEKPSCIVCGASTKYHRSTKRFADTCSVKCQSVNPTIVSSRKQTNLVRYGVDHNFKLIPDDIRRASGLRLAEDGKRICYEKYGVENVMLVPEIKAKHKQTMGSAETKKKVQESILSSRGRKYTLPENWQNEFNKYRSFVWHFTRHSNIQSLPNIEKRGKGRNAYHLDHRFSMLEGFANNIHPSIIGSIHNLTMLPSTENRKKWSRSSSTIGELMAAIEINNMERIRR